MKASPNYPSRHFQPVTGKCSKALYSYDITEITLISQNVHAA